MSLPATHPASSGAPPAALAVNSGSTRTGAALASHDRTLDSAGGASGACGAGTRPTSSPAPKPPAAQSAAAAAVISMMRRRPRRRTTAI